MNSSNSSKKEKINNSPRFKNLNFTKKTLVLNKSKLSLRKMNISSEILTALLKGIISLKKNDFFDYIIKMLKLILFYYKGNNTMKRNNFEYEFNSDENVLNLLYQNIFQVYTKETFIRKILMNDFNNNKKIFKNIHYIFIFYIYCGIEHIHNIINKDNKKKCNINNFIDYNELLNLLLQFMKKERCQIGNINNIYIKNKNEICIICSNLNKYNRNIHKTIDLYNDNISLNNKVGKSSLNIEEKIIFDYNDKHSKERLKIKKNKSNFINSDLTLKMMKLNFINKNSKNNIKCNNHNIGNNSNDKRLLNYLKTTIDEKIKNNLNSHREYDSINKEQISSELKNHISFKNNNKSNIKSNIKNNKKKNENKIYNYSYKNNIININLNKNYRNSIKGNNSLENFFSKKNNFYKNKIFSCKKKKTISNININNNHQIFFYPKVEQYLNNVYIINNNNNKNPKNFKEKKITDTISDEKILKEDEPIDENKNVNILNYIEKINKQINSMENINENFKIQTNKIKQEMMEIGNKK